MRIKTVSIKNFRRFSDLKIEGINEQAKLVILLGPNGSGKSSLFDAFSLAASYSKHQTYCWNSRYQVKGAPRTHDLTACLQDIKIDFHGTNETYPRTTPSPKDFYFRTSYRYETKTVVERLERMPELLKDEKDPHLMMNLDSRVSDNYKRMVSNSLGELFEPGDGNNVARTTLRDRYVSKLREAMKRVFGDLMLEGPGKPLDGGEFLFSKGTEHNFPYVNLSGGEKAAFDLLLDFIIKSEVFNDTVYCLDEPELHMHSALQGKLLDEIVAAMPGKSQLWIATHSVGMIRKAREIYEQNPNSVAFLNFSGRDFDMPQLIQPTIPSRSALREVFKVMLGDVVSLVAPKRIFLCEGQRREQGARRNPNFDARCYNQIFEREFPDVQFISVGGCNDVDKNALIAGAVLKECVSGVKIETIYDCDDRSPQEVADLVAQGGRVLALRDLENYLWDDEVLGKLCHVNQHDEMLPQLLATKTQLMVGVIPPDDVKSIAGPLYNAVKSTLSLTRCGNTYETFARDTLAPLIEPGMSVYAKLKKDIFGLS